MTSFLYFTGVFLGGISAIDALNRVLSAPLYPKTDARLFTFVASVWDPTLSGKPSSIQIGFSRGEEPGKLQRLTKGHFDYKPMYSPHNDKITFFRTSADQQFDNASIMVMNSDGSGLHQISGGMDFNMNPAWMRDGSNRVIWTHITDYTYLSYAGCLPGDWCPWRAFITCDTCEEKDITMISNHEELGEFEKSGVLAAEWAYDSFHDGRILIVRQLLTIKENTVETVPYVLALQPDGNHKKEFFALNGFEWNDFIHKVTMSPSERFMSYMRNGPEGSVYQKAELWYCRMDPIKLKLSDEVMITKEQETLYWDWYARFTEDEGNIIYASSRDHALNQIFVYNLDSRTTRKLTSLKVHYMYPCPIGMTTFHLPLVQPDEKENELSPRQFLRWNSRNVMRENH